MALALAICDLTYCQWYAQELYQATNGIHIPEHGGIYHPTDSRMIITAFVSASPNPQVPRVYQDMLGNMTS